MKFYFTFNHDDGGGWAEVEAEDRYSAAEAFNIYHPKRSCFIACAGVYPEDIFKTTEMYTRGNFGRKCVERISLRREEVSE